MAAPAGARHASTCVVVFISGSRRPARSAWRFPPRRSSSQATPPVDWPPVEYRCGVRRWPARSAWPRSARSPRAGASSSARVVSTSSASSISPSVATRSPASPNTVSAGKKRYPRAMRGINPPGKLTRGSFWALARCPRRPPAVRMTTREGPLERRLTADTASSVSPEYDDATTSAFFPAQAGSHIRDGRGRAHRDARRRMIRSAPAADPPMPARTTKAGRGPDSRASRAGRARPGIAPGTRPERRASGTGRRAR